MKKNKLKKAFTLVELLVVIAILATLATVSIIGYNSFINKAKISADEQAVTQMNNALKASEILDGKAKNLHDVRTVLTENGFNADKNMIPVMSGYSFRWDSEENLIMLVNDNNEVVYPKEYTNVVLNKNEQYDISYPAAKVEDTGSKKVTTTDNIDVALNCSFSFEGESEDDAAKSPYANWRTDFVISFDKDLKTNGQTYLAGQYGSYSANWEVINPTGLTITKDARIELVSSYWPRYSNDFTYQFVCSTVQVFNCGAYDDGTNKGTTMTVELCLYNPEDANDYIVVYTYKYTF